MSAARSSISALAVVAGCAALAAVVMNHREPRPATRVATVAVTAPQVDEADGSPSPAPAPVPAAAGDAEAVRTASAIEASAEPAAPTARDQDRKKHKKLKRKRNRDADARRRPAPLPPGRPTAPDRDAIEAAAVARRGLSSVGIDPAADAAWADAINDPARTAHERSDLIEDLNEEGFPDPAHVTPDDLPLIESRLALIERYAAEPMDDANAAAFAEAYNDLLGMYLRASGEQTPE